MLITEEEVQTRYIYYSKESKPKKGDKFLKRYPIQESTTLIPLKRVLIIKISV